MIRTDAIILRRTNYGEADRILLFLTPNHGQISAMARGVRKEKSRLAGGVELFAVCDVVLRQGKGDIATLTSSKLKKFFDQIMTDYDRMQFAYEAIKQVNSASKMLEEADFYDLLLETLASLNNLKIHLKIIEVWFYLHLAKLLGNGLNAATDDKGMKLVEGANYNFNSVDQVFSFVQDGRFSSDHIKFLRVIDNNSPQMASRVSGIDGLIDDCLFVAKNVAKI